MRLAIIAALIASPAMGGTIEQDDLPLYDPPFPQFMDLPPSVYLTLWGEQCLDVLGDDIIGGKGKPIRYCDEVEGAHANARPNVWRGPIPPSRPIYNYVNAFAGANAFAGGYYGHTIGSSAGGVSVGGSGGAGGAGGGGQSGGSAGSGGAGGTGGGGGAGGTGSSRTIVTNATTIIDAPCCVFCEPETPAPPKPLPPIAPVPLPASALMLLGALGFFWRMGR